MTKRSGFGPGSIQYSIYFGYSTLEAQLDTSAIHGIGIGHQNLEDGIQATKFNFYSRFKRLPRGQMGLVLVFFACLTVSFDTPEFSLHEVIS
jgi:hypothetical protein